jgi:hypothetical protein
VVRIAAIVEGHGEVGAVPLLIRRIAAELAPGGSPDVSHPIRVGRHKLLKEGELERSVELAARQAGDGGGVLILLDADEDCPSRLAEQILRRARAARSDREIRVVLAKHEFEGWFLAAAESLGGQRGLAEGLRAPPDPEAVRDAKGWLTGNMPMGRSYRETLDQPALAARFDLQVARDRAPSFDKLWRDVASLLIAAPAGSSESEP